jgi:hypothetical protein
MTDRSTAAVWKLSIVSLLASGYFLAWRAITGSVAPAPLAAGAPVAPPAPAPATVWIDQLPPDQRPVVTLPPGWRIAPRQRPAAVPGSRPIARAPARRPARVRTRSS